MKQPIMLLLLLLPVISIAQDYFLQNHGPFDADIPSPAEFLGYDIGTQHTRHDRIVSYFEELAQISERASFSTYGKTYELRPLVMLTVSNQSNLGELDHLREEHLKVCDPDQNVTDFSDLPIFVNLGYNVHGNEPSSSEAAMLAAYILVASQSETIEEYLQEAIFFIDPVINPDGRDRHTHWANMYKGTPPVADPSDAEHNEAWPRGRTNHYWFDLNRDWWLAVHPESQGKLNWYHQWYPNVVTDFHEMGTNSTHFFEPMKTNGSKDPVMPKENYTTLNDTFARYFSDALDGIGSLYFTKEVFDGTYPGYGSSYPDLQGGLGLLFEQASSRGHVQDRPMGELTFAFTIRNQLVSTMATVKASVEQKELLYNYQRDFFKSAITRANGSSVKAYVFGDSDQNRTLAFVEKLLMHQVKVYQLEDDLTLEGRNFVGGEAFVVPTSQPQYRIVQNAFETYSEYTDSVFYDASAWSLVNFYNLPYSASSGMITMGDEVVDVNALTNVEMVEKTDYAYLVPGSDYFVPAFMHHLKEGGVRFLSAFKPFTTRVKGLEQSFGYGSLLIPVARQDISGDSLHRLVNSISDKYEVEVFGVNTGYNLKGVDLGSRYFQPVSEPKVVLLIGGSVSSYEAGEVWHLLDTRVGMPITKVNVDDFDRLDLSKYNTMVMVSGRYNELDSSKQQVLKSWVSKGNTLVAVRNAVSWCIKNNIVRESLVDQDEEEHTDSTVRSNYVEAVEEIGRESVGGAIFEVDLDITHPIGFGYTRRKMPVYRNSTVWLEPSKNTYSTVASYTANPHLDGFITKDNLDNKLKGSASVVVSKVGSGRVVLFTDNPNFRGSWYGTNRMFLNALFLGEHIDVPE